VHLFILFDNEQSWAVRTPLVVEPKKISLELYKKKGCWNDFTGVCSLNVMYHH